MNNGKCLGWPASSKPAVFGGVWRIGDRSASDGIAEDQ